MSLSEYRSSAWRLPLCLEPVMDYNVVPIYHRFRGERDDAQVASALEALGPLAQSAQNTKRTLLFSASRTARAKQHASLQRSGAQFEHYYARPRPVRALGCRLRACSDGCSTKGCRIVRLSILSVVIAFSQYFIIINVCSLCQHTICATGTARAPMARC